MNNDDSNTEFVRGYLKSAMPPWPGDLNRDLWPDMLRRIQEAPAAFGWFEAALLAAILASVVAVPEFLPVILFHL
jgi:hypothetical protein